MQEFSSDVDELKEIKYFCRPFNHKRLQHPARMAELVDAHDSNSCSFGVPVRSRPSVLKARLTQVSRAFLFLTFFNDAFSDSSLASPIQCKKDL